MQSTVLDRDTTSPADQGLVAPDHQRDHLSPRDRALLTPEVLDRWTRGLAPGDITPDEIVELERVRQRNLRTVRQGAELTDTEFALVRYLQRHAARTRTYLQIAHHLWGTSERPITAYMMRAEHGYASRWVRHIWVLVSEIRRKLEVDPWRPQHLATVRRVGYAWYDDPPSLDDGIDYHRRASETEVQRAQLRYDFGLSEEDDPGVQRHPMVGPGHPDYQAIEADVTERTSRRS